MAAISKEVLTDTSIIIYILFALFSMSSWLDLNGVFAELPIMVNVLPEGWKLPSFLNLVIQAANIGPLIYTISNRIAPNKVKEWPVIFVLLFIGLVCCTLLSFFWDHTTHISGSTMNSTALMILSGILGLVDCTSSVVYRAYISYYKPQYVSALFIGENLGGFLAGVLGLIQGASGDPICMNRTEIFTNETGNYTDYDLVVTYKGVRFSVDAFYLITAAMYVVSLLSFTFIHCAPYSDRSRLISKSIYNMADANLQDYHVKEEAVIQNAVHLVKTGGTVPPDDEAAKGKKLPNYVMTGFLPKDDSKVTTECKVEESTVVNYDEYIQSSHFRFMIVVIFWCDFLLYGLMSSVQSFSTLPYGNLVYSLQVRLQLVVSPLVCFFSLFVTATSTQAIVIFVLIGSLMSAHQVVLAVLSPTPPLQDDLSGQVLVVLTGVLVYLFVIYAKVCVASIMHHRGGHSALLWYGVSGQAGQLSGGVVMFVVINVYGLLEGAPVCPG